MHSLQNGGVSFFFVLKPPLFNSRIPSPSKISLSICVCIDFFSLTEEEHKFVKVLPSTLIVLPCVRICRIENTPISKLRNLRVEGEKGPQSKEQYRYGKVEVHRRHGP